MITRSRFKPLGPLGIGHLEKKNAFVVNEVVSCAQFASNWKQSRDIPFRIHDSVGIRHPLFDTNHHIKKQRAQSQYLND